MEQTQTFSLSYPLLEHFQPGGMNEHSANTMTCFYNVCYDTIGLIR